MARPIRVEYANAVYHVTARSNGRKAIYHDEADLRKGLVLGGESLWNEVRELVAKAEDDEGIRWRGRADAEESARAIELLIEQEADRRVAIWLRVRVGGERMTAVAAEYGHGDGSGVHRVIKRLEEKAESDRSLSRRLKAPSKEASSVNS